MRKKAETGTQLLCQEEDQSRKFEKNNNSKLGTQKIIFFQTLLKIGNSTQVFLEVSLVISTVVSMKTYKK